VVLKSASPKPRRAPPPANANVANIPRDIRARVDLRFQAQRFVRWREQRR